MQEFPNHVQLIRDSGKQLSCTLGTACNNFKVLGWKSINFYSNGNVHECKMFLFLVFMDSIHKISVR